MLQQIGGICSFVLNTISPHYVPAQESKLCTFVAYLDTGSSGISYQTLKCYLSTVKRMQVEQGMHVLFTSMMVLEHVLKGVKEHAKNTKPSLTGLHVTSTILSKILPNAPVQEIFLP